MADLINRSAAEALIQEQIVNTVFQDTPKSSTFMQLATTLPNMTSDQTRIPVLSLLPMAYWVNGDTGFKGTSRQQWENVYLNAAELAVIVPIPESVVADASYDIMGQVTPRVIEAIGQRVDGATIFGNGRPSEWQTDIVTLARQAGNNVACSGGSITYALLMESGGLLSKVEDGGFAVNGVIASVSAKAKLRGIKTTSGEPIFLSNMQGATPYSLDGAPMYFPTNGAFDASVAQMIAGDFSQAVYALRQDVTVKILDQATIIDPATKAVIYSLAQQDMIALRVVFRMGWALPNPATRMNADRLYVPFAYLEPATAATTQAVTFTVTDGVETDTEAGTAATAYKDAVISVDGARKKTDASGQAVFDLRAGRYKYTVKKDGYKPVSGSVSVESAAVAEAVTLAAQ